MFSEGHINGKILLNKGNLLFVLNHAPIFKTSGLVLRRGQEIELEMMSGPVDATDSPELADSTEDYWAVSEASEGMCVWGTRAATQDLEASLEAGRLSQTRLLVAALRQREAFSDGKGLCSCFPGWLFTLW